MNIYDSKSYILKIGILINECSQYTNAQTAREHPERTKHCKQWLGPNQPGVTTGAIARTARRRHEPRARPPRPRARRRRSAAGADRHRGRPRPRRRLRRRRRPRRHPPLPDVGGVLEDLLPGPHRRAAGPRPGQARRRARRGVRAQPPRLPPGPMTARRTRSVFSDPIFIGAVTVLVLVAAVLLAYQANRGLPFVPVKQCPGRRAERRAPRRRQRGPRGRLPDRADHEDRAGAEHHHDPTTTTTTQSAQITLQLDTSATPIPDGLDDQDPAALGARAEVRRSRARALVAARSPTARRSARAPTPSVRSSTTSSRSSTSRPALNVERNLDYFGTALAGRGDEINRSLGALPELFGDLPPVARTLADPDTQLARLVRETGDAARIVAPQSGALARGVTSMADTFEATSRDPEALKDTIARTPATLDEGIRVAARTAPVPQPPRGPLRRGPGHRARAAREPAAGQQRARRRDARARPHARVHRRPPRVAARRPRARALAVDRHDARRPRRDTMKTLNPTLRYLGPHVTVCNYFTYMWTFLSDHFVRGGRHRHRRARAGQVRAAHAGRTR